jgi:hypothetical protein
MTKIDIRLLPLMATMYFMQQLDKSAVSFAAVFNIQKDAPSCVSLTGCPSLLGLISTGERSTPG